MRFRVDMRFAPNDTYATVEPWISEFLLAAPWIWQRQCSADTIIFHVIQVKQPMPLGLRITLDVLPTGLDTLSDLDIVRHTGSDPMRVRCAAPLYAWLASLRGRDALLDTWRTFWRRGALQSPIFLELFLVECLSPLRWLPRSKEAARLSHTDAPTDNTPVQRDDTASVCDGSCDSFETAQSGGYTL